MGRTLRKILSIFLVLAIVNGMIPAAIYAAMAENAAGIYDDSPAASYEAKPEGSMYTGDEEGTGDFSAITDIETETDDSQTTDYENAEDDAFIAENTEDGASIAENTEDGAFIAENGEDIPDEIISVDDTDSEMTISSSSEGLPSSYDMRDYGIVTPVKNQSPWGTCWSFSAVAAAETSILSAMGATYEETGLDLSERHAIWCLRQPLREGICDSQTGEGYYPIDDEYSSNYPFEVGGDARTVASLWALGIGPVPEADCPYQGNARILEHDALLYRKDEAIEREKAILRKIYARDIRMGWVTEEDIENWAEEDYEQMLESSDRYDYYSDLDDWSLEPVDIGQAAYTMTDYSTFFYATVNSVEAGMNADIIEHMKREMMAGHAVTASFCNFGLNTETWAYYNKSLEETNHAVCIVGWDDDYPAENFTDRPPGNGAWLIKNSYGSETDAIPDALIAEDGTLKTAMGGANGITDEEGRHTGYYWLSYFDRSLRTMGIFEFKAVPNNDLASALQYDYVPLTESIRIAVTESESSFANIYPVDHDLRITAIGTMAYAKDLEPLMGDYDVKLELYRLEEGATEPTDGIRIADQESHFKCAGYHRIELDDSVTLRKGERVGVVATVLYDGGNGNAFYCCPSATFSQKSIRKYTGKNYDYAQPKVNPGESFIHIRTAEEGEYRWIDLAEPMGETVFKAIANMSPRNGAENESAAEYFILDNYCLKAFTEPYSFEPVSIENASVAGVSKSYGYSGKAYEPSVTVKVDGETLEKDTDYTVSYADNTDPGTATITITGIGDYTGTRVKTFEIVDCVSKIVDGKTYHLIPKNNSRTAVCSFSGRMVNNTKVYITDRTESEAMKFKAVKNSDGTWKFINAKCELALAVQQNSSEIGKGLVLYDQTTRKAQNWKLTRRSDNSFAITNAVSGLYIAMSDMSAPKGTTLSIMENSGRGDQRFYLAETTAVSAPFDGTKSVRASKDKTFALNIASSSKTDGANVNLYTYTNTNAKKFRIMYSGGGYYRLVNVNSGMCLTVNGNSKTDGANIIQSKWAAQSAQRWKITRNSNGTVTLTNALGTVLHLSGNKTADNTNVHARKASTTGAQKWYLQ